MLFHRLKFKGNFREFREKYAATFPKSYRGCIAVFCKPATFPQKALWEKFLLEDNVWGAFGCHPHNANEFDERTRHFLKLALEHPKVRALGEIGLDYSNRNGVSRILQQKVFLKQINMALDRNLPLVIHCRDAHDDCIRILKETIPEDYLFHLHCFTDDWDVARRWLQIFKRCFIGITNLITFPDAKKTKQVALHIPLNRLLLETDSPYFIPRINHLKGFKISHPGMACHVAAEIAHLKEISVDEVCRWTLRNTRILYGIN
ncbi:putative deoxyribonuclease TATDN2 [Nephila pilipes]|uniref:Putative deoxyribonuclease TATDN2 n=1 Tax=Nephila pilipes TaxID=299642 RepID=A0A8X6QQ70_NEPPI|nr:putative deoxyribonuclease TATDN2 [Nephila pilipes]